LSVTEDRTLEAWLNEAGRRTGVSRVGAAYSAAAPAPEEAEMRPPSV